MENKKVAVRKLFLLLTLMLLSGALLSGCMTTRNMEGKPIMPADVGKIIDGVTTQSQLVSMFGPPYDIVKDPLTPGAVTYKYRFYYNKYVHVGSEMLTPSSEKYKEKLIVKIKDGIVVSSSFTSTGNVSLKEILKNRSAGGGD